MPFHVPTSAIPILQDPPFMAGLLLLATALGYRAIRILRAPLVDADALERGVLAAAVGLGFLQFLPFTLGMIGVLTPAAIWIGLAVLAAFLLPDMLRVAKSAAKAASTLKHPQPPAWLIAGSLFLLVPAVITLLQALCPPTDYDALQYHLNGPKRWLQWGRIDYLPTLVHTNQPMGAEMLYTIPLAVWSDTAAKLIHFSMGMICFLAIYLLGKRLRNPAVGFAAMLLFMAGVPGAYPMRLGGGANIDLGIAMETVCAVLALILWQQGVRSNAWLVVAALCAGFGASFKLTGLFLGVLLGILVLFELRRRGETKSAAIRRGAQVVAISLLPLAPWLFKTWLYTGNPVWPLLSSIFPSRDWSPEASRGFNEYFKYYNWGGSGGKFLSLSARKMIVFGTTGITLLFTALLVWRWKDREGRYLTFVAGILLAVSLWTTGLYFRYAIQILPLIFLIVFMLVNERARLARWVPAALLAGSALFAVNYVRGTWAPTTAAAMAAATGRLDRHEYLSREMPIFPIWDFVNANLPTGARLLTVGFNASYYSDRYCYVPDGYGRSRIRLDEYENFVSDLRRDNIRYMVLTPAGSTADLRTYNPSRNGIPFAQRLVKESGRELCAAAQDKLYVLDTLNAAGANTWTHPDTGAH